MEVSLDMGEVYMSVVTVLNQIIDNKNVMLFMSCDFCMTIYISICIMRDSMKKIKTLSNVLNILS